MADLESSAVPKSTRYQQGKWLKGFTSFLFDKDMNSNFETMTKQTIANSLRYFQKMALIIQRQFLVAFGQLSTGTSLSCLTVSTS